MPIQVISQNRFIYDRVETQNKNPRVKPSIWYLILSQSIMLTQAKLEKEITSNLYLKNQIK